RMAGFAVQRGGLRVDHVLARRPELHGLHELKVLDGGIHALPTTSPCAKQEGQRSSGGDSSWRGSCHCDEWMRWRRRGRRAVGMAPGRLPAIAESDSVSGCLIS